ncbi:MAG: sulfatase [Candidatus Aminicenantes bacterium]|nr:sulfatase [Candidatus Aminicenantes bacterium]
MRATGIAAAAGLIDGAPSFLKASPRADRPNVLFIAVDDLRPELGCFGSNLVKSPNIDRLARQGTVFARAYCQQSMCNPSRASLLTGLRPDTIRVWDQETHFRKTLPNVVTLPQMFKNGGYETAYIGKIFHNILPDPPSWSQPQPDLPATYLYMSSETRSRQRERQAAARRLGRSESWIEAYLRGPATECFEAPDGLYEDGAIADVAIVMLSRLRKKQPFFLGIGFIDPHLPFVAPKKYWDLYDRDRIPLAANYFLPKGAPPFAMNPLTELASYEDFVQVPNPTEGLLSESQARLLKHGYSACISFVDTQIGRVLDTLDHFKLLENTIIVLIGDSGWKLGEHGGWGKLTNYEIDTRTPLIISVPGQANKGVPTPALVEFVDVFPTLCELAGLQPPPDLEGTSMTPLFQDPGRPWKSAAFSQFPRGFTNRFMGRAMRTDRNRYIEWRDWFDDRLVAVELYDHETDPMENENIAEAPANKDLVTRLARQLAEGWRAARPK